MAFLQELILAASSSSHLPRFGPLKQNDHAILGLHAHVLGERVQAPRFHARIDSFILQQKWLERARLLLEEGRQSIKEIAVKLHFGHEFYFSSKTGVSPTQFRK